MPYLRRLQLRLPRLDVQHVDAEVLEDGERARQPAHLVLQREDDGGLLVRLRRAGLHRRRGRLQARQRLGLVDGAPLLHSPLLTAAVQPQAQETLAGRTHDLKDL